MKKLLLAALLVISSPALGQAPCASLSLMHELLQKRYHEVLFAVGNLPSGEPFRMYVGPETKTFTLLFSPLESPDLGCVLQSGENFGPAIKSTDIKGDK